MRQPRSSCARPNSEERTDADEKEKRYEEELQEKIIWNAQVRLRRR